MITSLNVADPVYHDNTPSRIDRFFLQFLRDKRDLVFVYETLRLTALMVPPAVLLYTQILPSYLWWAVSIVYLFLYMVFKGPYGLMLHCTSHRKMYKKEYGILNHYVPKVLGLLFGQTPDTYKSHHLGMHHLENNLAPDKSTTMPYKRDSPKDFIRYFLNFFFLGIYGLCVYLWKNKKKKLFLKSLRGEIFYIVFIAALLYFNWSATLVVFLIPFLFTRLIMMVGNWTQHAFVCPEDPGNPYKNSITCINVRYNRRCFNDGYHTNHHIQPAAHYTDHPDALKKNLDEYMANRALIFDGIDFGQVFFALMGKKYDKLAEHVINVNQTFSSKEELIAMMKERTQYIALQPS